MSIALLVIATGPIYLEYARNMLKSAKEYFPAHDVILFTDVETEIRSTGIINYHSEYSGFPMSTLMRYHLFLKAEVDLLKYDHVFYVDADMKFVAPIHPEEILSDGITATLHPGYVGKVGTPERRPESRAYIPINATNKYFCGGFNGGATGHFLWMAGHIKTHIDEDLANGITAVWHDESHLNAFLYYNCPPARVLTPSFCWPEGCQGKYDSWTESYEPKLVALTKKESHV
jgi:histo-blood group ABO system transferase